MVTSEIVRAVEKPSHPTVDEIVPTVLYDKPDREIVEQMVSPVMSDTAEIAQPVHQEISFKTEQPPYAIPAPTLEFADLLRLPETEIMLTETTTHTAEYEPDYAELLEQDLATEISDADLETIISQWKAELIDDTDADTDPVTILAESDSLDIIDTAPQLAELDDDQQLASPKMEAAIPPEQPVLETIEPAPDYAPPAVEALTMQLALEIETLEPEAVTEVHALIETVLQEIDQLQDMLAEMTPVETSVVPETAEAPIVSESIQETISLIASDSVVIPKDETLPVDSTALEAAVEKLCRHIGLDYTDEDIRQLINQLLASRGDLSEQDTDTTVVADADWGTHESLQWFTRQLRTMRRQTNLWHSLIGRVGRSALASLAGLQSAA